jgi:outer membrane receptor protein involved in Fe transport
MDSTVYRVRYGNSYGWMNWEADFGEGLSARTVASLGRITQDREGSESREPGDPPHLRVNDETVTWRLGLRQDWQLRRWDRMMLKWGLDLRWGTSEYDYFLSHSRWIPNFTDPYGPDFEPLHDTVTVALTRAGSQLGGYLADRLEITDRLTVEAGLRFDRQSHTGEEQLSPRMNGVLRVTPSTMLRGAWGFYHQSQGLHELWASDRDTTFYTAQRAEHRVVGLDHRFRSGVALRLEAYQRILSNPLPEYRRVARNMGALWEEAPADRVFVHPERGKAEGLELFLKSPLGKRLTWSGFYTLSRVREKVEGMWVPRPYDQRHAVRLQLTLRPAPDWSMSAGWTYHSPWPYTEVEYLIDETIHGHPVAFRHPGTLNQGRLTPYRRVDFRASRKLQIGGGDVLLYVDVFNLFNRQNAMDLEQGARWVEGHLFTNQDIFPQLGIMPSLGLKWTF